MRDLRPQAVLTAAEHSAHLRRAGVSCAAYLLEPVDQRFRATGVYGTGRDVLPAELAVPISKLATALGQFPYMEVSDQAAEVISAI